MNSAPIDLDFFPKFADFLIEEKIDKKSKKYDYKKSVEQKWASTLLI